ncbi:hypothetical protein CC1G_04922 [Coprinopsis cinerea okayama7|uniref:DUF6534 domain-containing protein n=1 Tax=Coprinopsis cinerea (strain Okayama-7 / 130 / ATCC MYA-4618 / FGSC 9003) TaxID=240176 RepID=A8PFJ8_COPC7|nr:hypothetical protein CC1G_04922 [Coprinopsis cinerea okayama7\|eukprot:XP_001841078.2 hypothetical protein CC1G_04922 [Coprinopsis cinerea okayama7\
MSAVPSLHNTIGAIQICSLVSIFLFGVLTLQSHLYFMHYPRDKWFIKALVTITWLLELGHSICVAGEVYRVTITYYGQPEELGRIPLLPVSVTFGAVITLLVHAFFSLRIYRLFPPPYHYLGVFILLASLIPFVGKLYASAQALKNPVVSELEKQWGWLAIALFFCDAGMDVLLSGSLVGYLCKQRGSPFRRTTDLVDRLIQYTVCTALLPCLTSLAAAISTPVGHSIQGFEERTSLTEGPMFIRLVDLEAIWLAIYTCLAKLYSNSVLAALNSRKTLRSRLSPTEIVSLPELGIKDSQAPPTSERIHSAIRFSASPVKGQREPTRGESDAELSTVWTTSEMGDRGDIHGVFLI